MKRHELSDEQWALLAEFFPPRKPARGGRWADDRTVLNGIFWRLSTGAPWRDLPDRYGPWPTVYGRFAALRRTGRLDRVIEKLQLRLNAAGRIDADLFCVDGTNVRATRAAAGAAKKKSPPGEPADHALGYSRGGFGTKVHLVTDGRGLPLAVALTAGQAHESTAFEGVMDAVRIPAHRGRPRCRPVRLAGDRGYSYPRIRRWLARHGIKSVIPRRKDQNPDDGRHRFDREVYRRRAVVEQCVGWLKESRAVGTRFDKLAVNYLATLKLAMIRRYLRALTAIPDPPNRA
jgi:transposase